MTTSTPQKRSAQAGSSLLRPLLLLCALLSSTGAFALEDLNDEGLSSINGAGIAFGLEGFSFQMAPTSYIELTGTRPNTAALAAGWKLGNARFYGLSITGASTGAVGTGADWFNGTASTCVPGADGVGCPLGAGTIFDFASVYDPYLLRVYQYQGYDYQGNYRNQSTNPALTTTYMPTVLEFMGPSFADAFRWSFWGAQSIGDGSVAGWSTSTAGAWPATSAGANPGTAGCLSATGGTTNTGYCGLQSQVIIQGKNIAYSNPNGTGTAKPTVLRLMLTQNNADPTLGFTYDSALSGNFRFSVAQTTNTNATAGQVYRVPNFNNNEGLYFNKVNAFLPLGHLHYQAVTLNRADANGNFTITVTPLNNLPNLYNEYYCGALNPAVCAVNNVAIGGQTTDPAYYVADGTSLGAPNMTERVVASPNPATHGFVYWGDTSIAAPTGADATNGIFFKTPAGAVTNIGTAQLSGLVIQSLVITSLGATP